MVDEICHGLTYGMDAASVLEVDYEVSLLNIFSKYFGMTSWHPGWLVVLPAAVCELEKLAQNLYISAQSMAQYVALAFFSPQTLNILEEHRAEFGWLRDSLPSTLCELAFGIALEPEGVFYLYANISTFGGFVFAFCRYFFKIEYVAFTFRLDFGRYQSCYHLHFAYMKNLDRLHEAVERIVRGLRSWQG